MREAAFVRHGGTIGAPAAIANAVAEAVKPLGDAVTALPIVGGALQAARRLGPLDRVPGGPDEFFGVGGSPQLTWKARPCDHW